MKEGTNYVKRTQGDYTLTFKLSVVKEVKFGHLSTVLLRLVVNMVYKLEVQS